MASWFPVGRNDEEGWRLDIVSLLAVIGESSMEEHSQVLTASWTAMLPRIIPAPQTLLKPNRPTRLPSVNASVIGVHNGTSVSTLNYFPNIIHPIEDLPRFGFQVLLIRHKSQLLDEPYGNEQSGDERSGDNPFSTSIDNSAVENGPGLMRPQKRSIIRRLTAKSQPPLDLRVPSNILSPLSMLSIASFLLTVGLIIWAALIRDGTALTAVGTISLASSVVGYASWWSPVLEDRIRNPHVPPGDVVVRTREGALLLVKCNEDVARALYTGSEECEYYVNKKPYRFLVALGTFLLMISVVLLGNCHFTMQAAIGVSYIVLNGAYWAASLVHKDKLWDLSSYVVQDITPDDAKDAHLDTLLSGKANFTRTMWYAIRETKTVDWVRRGGAAPNTPQWDKWLEMAKKNASVNRGWDAVRQRELIVGRQVDVSQDARDSSDVRDTATQHAPHIEIPQPANK